MKYFMNNSKQNLINNKKTTSNKNKTNNKNKINKKIKNK